MPYKLLTFALCLLLLACKKKIKEEPVSVPYQLKNGILVLNEGLFNQNNATLGWFDLNAGTYNNQFFEEKTGRSLGDTGNDLKRYGGKIYVVVNVSSTLEILDAFTGKSLKQIPMIANGTPKQPRFVTFSGSKAYISCYDGYVDVLDTASLTINQRIQVGANPEGLVVSNGKLFVANSGGLNYPNVDSTVSVIDLGSHTELTRITVGKNPGDIAVDPSGDVYVISRGNYSTIPSRMHRINAQTNTKEQSFTFDASSITPFNNQFLISSSSGGQSQVALFDTQNESILQSNFLNTSNIETLYELYYHPSNSKIYCMDAKNYTVTGQIHIFSNTGTFERTLQVGLNPSKIIIYE